MQTKEVTISQIKSGDWFILGGRFYLVLDVEVTDFSRANTPYTRVTFHNPHWMPSYLHELLMDSGFPMTVIKQ